jgi:hypothetical protein
MLQWVEPRGTLFTVSSKVALIFLYQAFVAALAVEHRAAMLALAPMTNRRVKKKPEALQDWFASVISSGLGPV